jgi:acetoin utilization deacetylase AcuC-like enzyme
MQIVYSPRYHIDIGAHVFPTIKYERLWGRVEQLGHARRDEMIEPEPATWDELALVHTDEYLEKIRTGTLSLEELAQLELPWSTSVVEGFRLMTGGTIAAARRIVGKSEPAALLHIGGGFHHAFANHGEGFCLFNDVAVAIRILQKESALARAAVVDCDVHHGNGTAFIFERDPSVFTFSIHQQHNYPMFKPRSALDIGLPDRVTDDEYHAKLSAALPTVFASKPDVVFYLAGADPFEGDQLGGLALTRAGLLERDRLVFDACAAANRPVVVTLAGGYARRLEDTVAIHRATIELAARTF